MGFESVLGRFCSNVANDNTLRHLTLSSAHSLRILCSWHQHKKIHCYTWYSHDGHTAREIYHIITRNPKLFSSCWTIRGVECPANTDHYLVVAKANFTPIHLDSLYTDPSLQRQYQVTVR